MPNEFACRRARQVPVAEPSKHSWQGKGAAFLLLFTLMLWLNQSISSHAWGGLRDRVWKTHTATTTEVVRYPVVFLYRHSFDEELYFNLSGEILGKPHDGDFLAGARMGTGTFAATSAPADGKFHAPYAEVPLEYPALSLPFLLAPRLFTNSLDGYAFVFSAILGLTVFGAFTIVLRLVTTHGSAERTRAYVLAAALSIAHGALFVQRLDGAVALLLACALHFWVRGRFALLGMFLGLAAAFKLTPLLLLLPVVAGDRRLLQHARSFLPALAGATAVGLFPMFLFSRDALTSLLRYHGGRGLHCESTWATLYGLFSAKPPQATVSYGSLNVDGPIPSLFAKLALPATLVALALLSLYFFRRRRSGAERLSALDGVRILVASCIVLWLTSKVFSPQYLSWAVPLLVPCLLSRRDRLAALLYGLALVITQTYFRGYYDAVSGMERIGLVTLLVRDAALGASAWLLAKNVGAGESATSFAEHRP